MTSPRSTGRDSANDREDRTSQVTERLFYPCSTGFLFTAPSLSLRLQLPFFGMIVLSLDDRPVRVRLGGNAIEHSAMAIWTKDVQFDAMDTAFVCIGINPLHSAFRSFVQIGKDDVVALDRRDYSRFDQLLHAASHSRRLAHGEALSLFQGVAATTLDKLPRVAALDERAYRLKQRVCENPRVKLSDVADELQLSYHRTSHLFAEAVGLPIRTYQLWQKLYRAGATLMTGASLTEVAHAAGFVDSAHYSKAFHTAYGRNPTDMFKSRRHIVFFRDAFSEASIGNAIREQASSENTIRDDSIQAGPDALPSNPSRVA